MRFTEAQTEAIFADNGELLVSAAAGSGKTAVLVERILHMIEHKGMSIDRMLIVTFTRAAASELRERLELRLSEAAEKTPALQKQADLVANAQISTIHSYCQRVVRQNFQHCQVDPQFALSDDRTRMTLYQESLEETLELLYNEAMIDADMAELVHKYPERDIVTMMGTLYSFLMSRPGPMDWLVRHADKEWSADTIDDEPMAKAFCAEAALVIQGMLSLWKETEELARDPGFPAPYTKTVRLDGQLMDELSINCKKGFSTLVNHLGGLKFTVLSRFKPETEEDRQIAEAYKEYRGRYKDMVDDLKKLLPTGCEQGLADIAAMQPATRGLSKIIIRFHENFQEHKRAQGVLDFNDLEHMTLEVLSEEALRAEQAEQFDAIFVDEYQDVSALQEAILNGLKRGEKNAPKQYFFYVGDVKQSIYRFRLAEPTLFLTKLQSFSSQPDAPQRKIILNRNFRSRTGVLDSVNRVFEHVMDSRVTEIDYDADAKLYPGAHSHKDPLTELHILNSAGRKPSEMVLAEAELIARDILQTVGSPILDAQGEECGVLHYRDIAILMPVSKNIADKVELVLSRAGIPVYCENSVDSLRSDEITQVAQHLLLMDNLMNDVPLISELRSPLFEMTETELAQIRLKKPQREASFLEALRAAAEDAGQPSLTKRCAEALDRLEHERFLYNSMQLDEYLWDFLMRSGLYAHYGAQPGGKLRQANLRMLCHRAGEYAKAHSDGLHGFLETITLDADAAVGGSPTVINPWEDVVRIMTIHKSKGLEFPTVYVMGLGGALRRRTATRALSVHGKIGFGLGYVNEKVRTKRTTLIQGAIDLIERNEERAERARVLYVAMTRPKSRLVLLGSASEKAICYADVVSDVENRSAYVNDVLRVRSAHSMLEWLSQCIQKDDILEDWARGDLSTEQLRETHVKKQLTTEPTSFPQKTGVWRIVFHSEPDSSKHSQKDEKVKIEIPKIARAFDETDLNAAKQTTVEKPEWSGDPVAPKLALAHRPLKLGVTALCRALEESEANVGAGALEEDGEETVERKRYPMELARPRLLGSLARMPAFMEPKGEERALQSGVQTHRLLSLVDLAGASRAAEKPDGMAAYVNMEVERLEREGIATPAEAALMDVGMVARFLRGELGVRMLKSQRVMREWSFNLRINEPVETILQGVIDLCFLEEGAWVLVDFKTDRVKSGDELWQRYGRQLQFYREALSRATPYPVREFALYSLRLGELFAGCD